MSQPLKTRYFVAGPPFDAGDIVLQSSDQVRFTVYQNILSLASPVFDGMFTLGPHARHKEHEKTDTGIPIVSVEEDSKTLCTFLRLLYPIRRQPLSTLTDVTEVFRVGIKYDVDVVIDAATTAMRGFVGVESLRVFAIACRFRLEDEARAAAGHLVQMYGAQECPLPYVSEMEHVTAGSYFRLLWLIRTFKQTLPASIPQAFWKTFSIIERNSDDGIPMFSEYLRIPHIEDPLKLWLDSKVFDRMPSDVVVRCDSWTKPQIEFPAHKAILALVSKKLAAKLSDHPSPADSPQVISVWESPIAIYMLLRAAYAFALVDSDEDEEIWPDNLRYLVMLARAAEGLEMHALHRQARKHFRTVLKDHPSPLAAYFWAIRAGWEEEAKEAAKRAIIELDTQLDTAYVDEMEDAPARAYYNLLSYRDSLQRVITPITDRYKTERTLEAHRYPDSHSSAYTRSSGFTPSAFDKIHRHIAEREIPSRSWYYSEEWYDETWPSAPLLIEESLAMDKEIQTAMDKVCGIIALRPFHLLRRRLERMLTAHR